LFIDKQFLTRAVRQLAQPWPPRVVCSRISRTVQTVPWLRSVNLFLLLVPVPKLTLST